MTAIVQGVITNKSKVVLSLDVLGLVSKQQIAVQ